MKAVMKKTVSVFLTILMVLSLFPVTARAYVGAMTQNEGGVTAGQQDGYLYLKNDYIGFYIRPEGNLTTVPSQKTLEDVKSIGATEAHAFYRRTFGVDVWYTDLNNPIGVTSRSQTIVNTDPDNPKLRQVFTLSDGSTMTIDYSLVRLDRGETDTTTSWNIIEKEPVTPASYKTWGVLASATITNSNTESSVLWMTRHVNFGAAGHNRAGNVRLNRYLDTYASTFPYTRTTEYFTASISAGLSRTDTNGISEAYTDSFSYANQFVAMRGYWRASADDELIAGIRGHRRNYADKVAYYSSRLDVEHGFSGSGSVFALWGFRDLFTIADSDNIPPDPIRIPQEASCVGIVNNNGALSAQAGKNETELKAQFGSKLVAVFRGEFDQENDSFVFTQGAAQLSPALTATWTNGSGEFTVSANGTITANGVHLSAPTFKFYSPKDTGDTSLQFGVSGGKLTVGINPNNNDAILHIDIPGAVCSVEGVTTELSGNLIFSGKMGISTPVFEAANISITRLGMSWQENAFRLNGIEASGAVDMQQLLGLDVGSAEAEINSFPGEERYAFKLELNVFDMFEAKGELELKRIFNGALIPNTLVFRAASEVGIPLVPPVVVAELNGLGGGFKNLADTINGDFFAVPPLRLLVSAKGSVLEIIEGWCTIEIGAGFYKASLTDATLLEMDIIDEYSWYMELAGDIRNYNGSNYKGLKVGGGMTLVLSIPSSDMPFIQGGGGFNASAYAGLNDYKNPTKAYLSLGCDGKLFGLVQIPADAWLIGQTMKIASAEIDFALGGQTTVNVAGTSFSNAIKDAFGSISGYGGVAYTGRFIGFPYRIYYIFQNKKVGIDIGGFLKDLAPFDPNPYAMNSGALVDPATGEQVGVMVMNDNLTLLGSSTDSDVSAFLVGQNDASEQNVTISQTDELERSYQVDSSGFAHDPNYLVFSLQPHEGTTAQELFESLTVQKSGEGSPLTLTKAIFNEDNEFTNEGEANAVIGEESVTLFLPSKGGWTISSSGAAFDIACYYARPYASFGEMSVDAGSLTGSVLNRDSGTKYILRTYLSAEKGGTDILLSQSDILSTDAIIQKLQLSGSAAPSGSYYVTAVLLEEVTGDFDGDGVGDASYVTTDSYKSETTVNYVNNQQPNVPEAVTLATLGSELMRVSWKAPLEGPGPDGYCVRLYKKNGGSWADTGAGYLLKAADLTPDENGVYTFDMAVTAGGDDLRLEAEETYKAGISAYCYLEDENGEVSPDSLPVNGGEKQSDGVFLKAATYPKLAYSPNPSSGGDTIKLLSISGVTTITVTSDVNADIVVTRMDNNDVLSQISAGTTLTFDTPVFDGALNLKISAVDAEGDKTTDYLGLRFDNTAPLITFDSESFTTNRETGAFTATGVTESGARITGTWITNSETNGLTIDNDEDLNDANTGFMITADENGVFTILGRLNAADTEYEIDAADSATLVLHAGDTAGNMSESVFAQIVRADEAPVNFGDGESSGAVVKADSEGNVSAAALKAAAAAAGRGGTVSVEASVSTVRFTGEGLNHLIDNQCALHLTNAFGTIIIPTEVLSQLGLNADSIIEIMLDRVDDFENPALSGLYDSGFPIFEIRITVDGRAVHRLAGAIGVVLSDSSFGTIPDLRVIHVLGSGEYREEAHTLDGESLSLTLSSLSHICILDGTAARELLKNPFSDVFEDDWYYDNVLLVSQMGLMNGTAPGMFCPDLPMSRAMAVTVIYRMSGGTGDYTNGFSDILAGSWYEKAAAWAAAKGISDGVGDSTFAPEANITREQLAAMLYRYAQNAGYDVSQNEGVNLLLYHDAGSISDYAIPAFRWACGAGIMNGDNLGSLNPQNTATRAETAAMLQRFIKYSFS